MQRTLTMETLIKYELPVKKTLLIIAWVSIVGGMVDGMLVLYALWINYLSEWALLDISLDDFLKEYVQIIYWIKQLAFYVLPERFVLWLFNLPALIYLPFKMFVGMFGGWWVLSAVNKKSDI